MGRLSVWPYEPPPPSLQVCKVTAIKEVNQREDERSHIFEEDFRSLSVQLSVVHNQDFLQRDRGLHFEYLPFRRVPPSLYNLESIAKRGRILAPLKEATSHLVDSHVRDLFKHSLAVAAC